MTYLRFIDIYYVYLFLFLNHHFSIFRTFLPRKKRKFHHEQSWARVQRAEGEVRRVLQRLVQRKVSEGRLQRGHVQATLPCLP